MMYYKLDADRRVVPSDTMQLKRVAWSGEEGKVWVSTMFLSLDHSHHYDDMPREPIVFETMIFGGPHADWQERCSTWDQAIVQHCKACELAGVPYTEANAALHSESPTKEK